MQTFTIPVDPGYMFDFLSIYQVKIQKKGGQQNIQNFNETYEHIQTQISPKLMVEIITSPEYDKLTIVNGKLFDLVDLAKRDEVKASEVDAGVWERYLAKKALQEKFFPNTCQKEQKFGYEQTKV